MGGPPAHHHFANRVSMRPRLATVLSPRPWEARIVEEAADTCLVRLVARCYDPGEIPPVDALLVGTETPWLNPAHIATWQRRGIAVVGMFPLGDRAAIAFLCRSFVDQLFVEEAEPLVILRAVCELTGARGQNLSNRLWASS